MVSEPWVQFGGYGVYGEDVVVAQIEFRTKLYIDPGIETFPLNKVAIILKPNIRTCRLKEVKHSWRYKDCDTFFGDVKPRYPEERNAVNVRASPAVPNLSFRKPFKLDQGTGSYERNPPFIIGAESGIWMSFFAIIRPIFVVVLASHFAMRFKTDANDLGEIFR